MKNILFSKRLMIILFLGLFIQCKDDDNPPQPAQKVLPEASTEGQNTFGCLIDGQVFIAERSKASMFEDFPLYFAIRGDTILDIFAKSNQSNLAINIFAGYKKGQNLKAWQDGSEFPLTFYRDYNLIRENGKFTIDTTQQNSITILRDDEDVIAGLFEFTVINLVTLDTLQITEGRFDIPKL